MKALGEVPQWRAFAYHRALAPMMWAFAFLGFAELAIVHLLVALFWSGAAAFLLSALSLAAIAWLLLLIRSFKRLPVLISDEGLVLRSGKLFAVEIPLDKVAGLRSSWDSTALRSPGLLNMALIAYPNVIVDFAEPVPWRRKVVGSVAHRLDDPAAFASALVQLKRSHESPGDV